MRLLTLSLIFFLISLQGEPRQAALSYGLAGRLGDSLISYLHALYFSSKYEMPLAYREFEYSDQLALSDLHPHRYSSYKKRKQIKIENEKVLGEVVNIPFNGVFVIPYFPESSYELKKGFSDTIKKIQWPYFAVDWKDPTFRSLALRSIAPKTPLSLVEIPKGFRSIAIHMRRGGNYDPSSYFIHRPLQFAPMHYYEDQIKKVCEYFPNEPLYFHLFTDDPDPKSLAEHLLQFVDNQQRVRFGFRESGNSHKNNVLEDFFSFFLFDCFIRTDSNFSRVSTLLHDFTLVTTPADFLIKDDIVTITKVEEIWYGVRDNHIPENSTP